jgi:immune inhibitor A
MVDRHRVCKVPPAPHVMAFLLAEYRRALARMTGKISFRDYLALIGFTDPAEGLRGADEGTSLRLAGEKLVSVPRSRVAGELRVKVLLADFDDNVGELPSSHYEDMLFSKGVYATGSMRDFFAEASCGKVDVVGSVHGWFRMPRKYGDYVGADSGTGAYPRNAQKLAEDVIAAAKAGGVSFEPGLDKFGQGVVTALFVVHAGPGAETFRSVKVQKQHIWSHKAEMHDAIKVNQGLYAASYLTVPENCRMGVCAHELGHLAFQWDDFYDPNYAEDGDEWDGAGTWDLMAGGSWNEGGDTPAHPAGLHKLQHGWLQEITVAATTRDIVIPPYSANAGAVVRVRGKKFSQTQSIVIENRQRRGFDMMLSGAGVLVWRVDTQLEQTGTARPAMLLVQADGRHDLEVPDDENQGDAGDPFPGASGRTSVGDTGDVSTSFPGAQPSGVSIENIRIDAATGAATLDVVVA